MRWGKLVFTAVAPLFLSGCLWGPGKFTSDLALRKDGRFTLDYRGEILLQLPDDKGKAPEPWADSMARCYADGRIETVADAVPIEITPDEEPTATDEGETRPCTTSERTKLKAAYEKESAAKNQERRQESENVAKIFGLPGADDESNRRFAANLTKYQGWKSARYVGKGVFDVVYHFEGRIGQDFAFPMMPDSDLIIPFIMIRTRTDGSVMVTAPALTGGSGPFGARAKAMGLPDKSDGPVSRAVGRFTIVTDGEILTNNSEDGPAVHPSGRQVRWDVGPGSARVPEMLVRL